VTGPARVSVIAQETGWELYDPHPGLFIDPRRAVGRVREMFDVGVAHMERVVAEARRPDPW